MKNPRVHSYLNMYKETLHWINMFIDKLSDEDWNESVLPNRNHGIWLLGHMVASDDDLSLYINKDAMLYPEYQKLFAQGSKCLSIDAYPSLDTLKDAWTKVCEKNKKIYSELQDTQLDEAHHGTEDFVKTKEDVISHWLIHQAYHSGQLGLLVAKVGKGFL